MAGGRGAPRGRGWIEKTAARESAARRKGRGSRGPEESERARAGLARVRVAGGRGGEGGARGRELPKGEGAAARGPRAPGRLAPAGKERRKKVNLAPLAFGMGKDQRGAHARREFKVSGCLTAPNAASRCRFTMSV